MAAVKLPDGRELDLEAGESALDVAGKIGPRLARDALVAKVNGEVVDLDSQLEGGEEFEVVTKDSPEGLYVLRHSTAHAMAQAIQELYPGSKLTIGPPIENGFYYDIEVEGRITDDDLPRIEERMREISGRDLPVYCEPVSKEEAEKLYEDNPYKLELIEDLEDGDITIYRQGDFFDLCRGPHVPSTGRLGAFKLQNIAGAYWRGDENNTMLTRIYGTAWPTEKQLEATCGVWRRQKSGTTAGSARIWGCSLSPRTLVRAYRSSCRRARCCGILWRTMCARSRPDTATIMCGPAIS